MQLKYTNSLQEVENGIIEVERHIESEAEYIKSAKGMRMILSCTNNLLQSKILQGCNRENRKLILSDSLTKIEYYKLMVTLEQMRINLEGHEGVVSLKRYIDSIEEEANLQYSS